MNILINATQLGRKNGMNNALSNILSAMTSTYGSASFIVLVKKSGVQRVVRRNNVFMKVVPGWIPFPIVEQIIMPILARVTKVDVMLSPYNTFPLLTFGIRNVAIIHDLIFMGAIGGGLYQKVANMYRRLIVPNAKKVLSEILTDSEFSKNEIVKLLGFPPARVTVAPLAVDEALSRYLKQNVSASSLVNFLPREYIENIDGYFLHLSALDPRKNTEFVIQSFVRYKQKYHNNIGLILVGKLPSNLIPIVSEREDVAYLEYPSTKVLASLYKHCIATLFPSSYEGFGLPILESYTARRPVITLNTSSLPEVGGDLALYISELDEELMINAMHRARYDKNYLSYFSNSVVDWCKRFSWEKTAQAYGDVLKLEKHNLHE